MQRNVGNHNTSRPNLAGKCQERPQFSDPFPARTPTPQESSTQSRSPTVTA
jgi:hypothetical protein